jgi:hypothetical protein
MNTDKRIWQHLAEFFSEWELLQTKDIKTIKTNIQPQQILETTSANTQEKETATDYNRVIPHAHALYTSPLLTTPNRLLTFPLARPPTCLNPVRCKYPTDSKPRHTSLTCLWRWNRYSVPKRRLLALRRRGNTQKKSYFKHFTLNL